MKLEISHGVNIHISDQEMALLSKLPILQAELSDEDLKLILRLINKCVVKRRSSGGIVSYEVRSRIHI